MSLRAAYLRDGVTPVLRVLSPQALVEAQTLIDAHLQPFYAPEVAALPLAERLRRPFAEPPPPQVWSALMARANDAPAIRGIIEAPEVRAVFEDALGGPVEPFPVSLFRARFPDQVRAHYDWHQDAGTWYVTRDGRLAEKAVATLWLSINGADAGNSIEILPRRGEARLRYHRPVDGQGRFRAAPQDIDTSGAIAVACAPGEGVLFDQLTLHRSVPARPESAPRYSIDIRYYRPNERARYPVDLRFRLRRWRALAALG